MTVSLAPTNHQNHRVPTCACTDPEVDRLRDLMAQGVSQVEASHYLWGDPGRVTSWPLVRDQVQDDVRRVFSDFPRLPWLRLGRR